MKLLSSFGFILSAGFLFSSIISSTAYSHGGGLAADGCHNDRSVGERHCHRSTPNQSQIRPTESSLNNDSNSSMESWNGLTIALESRCTPYNKKKQYPYSSTIEPRIANFSELRPGEIYAPYSNVVLGSFKDTDIEHIVATSEAHDSGLCAASAETKRRFANDLLNLTLATPNVNRYQKSGKDLAEWQPQNNRCWFFRRVVAVKKKYGLTIDPKEAEVMKTLASQC